ncbi:MAG: 3',5'-cyclic adenosine monophosphate phosphodiesterase CpdA [candidate division WS2 bacterium]|nr:3',5'-cyclic adenosine monophosphate phosphodiesterase CpdA [Candidatus Lithacetigena glycinireducens]
MKAILVGDLHLREKAPAGRIDDFAQVQRDKVRQILTIAKEQRVDFILQAGDFFDYPKQKKDFIYSYVDLFKEFAIPIYCVLGNHDLFSEKTPLYWLKLEKVITVIEDKIELDDVVLYGVRPYGEIPQPENNNVMKKNVLVIHKMIGNEPQLLAQNIVSCSQFANQTVNYRLRLVGDYHFRWEHFENGWTINPGAVVRLRRTKWDMMLEPSVVLWSSETEEITWYKLNFKPYKEVFKDD